MLNIRSSAELIKKPVATGNHDEITQKQPKKGTDEMAKRLDGQGNVLEDKHFLALALNTGENGDERDELVTIAVSRDELKMLCGVLQGIGDGECWLRLCLSIGFEYLSDSDKVWQEMPLFTTAYNDDFFDDWVTIRALRGNLFFPLFFLAIQRFIRRQMSPESCLKCVEVFGAAGWQAATQYLESEIGLSSSEILDLTIGLNGQEVAGA